MEKTEPSAVYCYSGVSHDISVTVRPAFLEDESDPEREIYAFSYLITIENLGTETAQLIERHWIVESDGESIAEIVGPGVVGVQPVLKPGEKFSYTSSAVIQDPVGAMHGSYTFRSEHGTYFDVAIPRFDLIYPIVLH